MKNTTVLLSIILSGLFVSTLPAQTNFTFMKTTYVGALDTGIATDWTRNWTNWTPETTVYPEPTDLTTLDATLASLPVLGIKDITSTLTLDASQTYLLKGIVVVREGGKLIIPAGTVIRAEGGAFDTPKNYASILVERGGQIEVLGTATDPVVITSAKGVGARKPGDWGGLNIAGQATHNRLNGTDNNNVSLPITTAFFDANLGRIGGTISDDNSGTIRYLRLEFGGLRYVITNQVNGLTLGAVGSATELHHIQVSLGTGDGFSWLGGTVNSSHLIAFKVSDDNFDTDGGYSGKSQFGIGVQDTAYYELPSAVFDGLLSAEGFESDNEPTGTAVATPYTNGIFTNYTMIGPVPVGSTYPSLNTNSKTYFRRGARIRRNSSLRIVNSIFMGYRNFLMVDGDSTLRSTNYPPLLALVTPSTPVDEGSKQIFFSNNLIVNTDAAFNNVGDTVANGLVEVTRANGCLPKLLALDAWIKTPGPLANNIDPVPFTTGTVLINPLAAATMPDFRPVVGSPALSGANFNDNPLFNTLSSLHIKTALTTPVYPNPISNGTLHFGRRVLSFGLFNAKGQLVKSGSNTDHANMEDFAPGVYFLQFDGIVQKLIVAQ